MKKVLIGLLLSCTALHGHGFNSGSLPLVGRAEQLPSSTFLVSSLDPPTDFTPAAGFILGFTVGVAVGVVASLQRFPTPHGPEGLQVDPNQAMAQLD